jgi:hypothetical protein
MKMPHGDMPMASMMFCSDSEQAVCCAGVGVCQNPRPRFLACHNLVDDLSSCGVGWRQFRDDSTFKPTSATANCPVIAGFRRQATSQHHHGAGRP